MTAISFLALLAIVSVPAASAAPRTGRYNCVLMGQGACSDEVCLGNRISPNDRNVRLVVDFGTGTASLNNIPGRIVSDDGVTVIRWHLSMIDDTRVDLSTGNPRPIINLGPTRGSGSTAAFGCRKEP